MSFTSVNAALFCILSFNKHLNHTICPVPEVEQNAAWPQKASNLTEVANSLQTTMHSMSVKFHSSSAGLSAFPRSAICQIKFCHNLTDVSSHLHALANTLACDQVP